MFSDHLQKTDHRNGRKLLLIAGVLILFFQLAAMALVADAQVKKAEVRESKMTSQRVALAECFANTSGTARSNCTKRAYSDDSTALPGEFASNNMMAYDGAVVRAPAQGVMAASFAN